MPLKRVERELLHKFILQNVKKHPKDIAALVASTFGLSRQAVNINIRKLINAGLIISEGITRGIEYKLKEKKHIFTFDVTPNLKEDEAWREKIFPILPKLKENILNICNYGFTEMLNNVIDHSESDIVEIEININAIRVSFVIIDRGVGIFDKIQKAFNLSDPRHAILELAKGKVTTDPSRHTGEGIFFTSRIFDDFDILSQDLYFHGHKDDDWLLDREKITKGTAVFMEIYRDSEKKAEEIFLEYSPRKDDYGFTKTKVPVKLLKYEGEELISRSQAKRLTIRFDKFKEVILDFEGVKKIGQPFADEIFRVFRNKHPEINLMWINENQDVDKIIKHVLSNK
ncbi:MAG: DUF4325 domain-containing protein [Candidatus Omnitrophica bacterium]|nr:DUF4325 domain-containing protein [Candidatus Omnitrophota bacterium]